VYGPLVCRFGVLARFVQIQTNTDAPERCSVWAAAFRLIGVLVEGFDD
jgi:hypothetical protein